MKSRTLLVVAVAAAAGLAAFVVLQTSRVTHRGVEVGVKEASACTGEKGYECRPKLWYLDSDGEAWPPDRLAGKVVVINFWATWCKPCNKEIPALSRVYTKYKDQGLVMLGVLNEDVEASRLQRFVKRTGLSFPVVRIDQEIMSAFASPSAIPTTFIYDRAGKLQMMHRGELRQATLGKLIEKLIAEKPPAVTKAAKTAKTAN